MATSLLRSKDQSPKGEFSGMEKTVLDSIDSDSSMNLESSGKPSIATSEEYALLQLRIYLITLVIAVIAVFITAFFLGSKAALSLLVGALSGIFYLRLLARNVGKLGKSSNSLGKVQLVIPALLVIAVSKLPALDLLPALLGFLLYKPSLILQVFFESKTKASP